MKGVKLKAGNTFIDVSVTAFAKTGRVHVDNWIFRLHYILSVMIVLAFAMGFSISDWVKPISCLFLTGCQGGPGDRFEKVDTNEMINRDRNRNDALHPKDFCSERDWLAPNILKDYCWTVKDALHIYDQMVQNHTGMINTYPGIGNPGESGYKAKHIRYYQWLPAILLFQLILFRGPGFIWRMLEEGRMERLCGDLIMYVVDSKKRIKYSKQLSDYLVQSFKFNNTTLYAYTYVMCELVNLISVLVQLRTLDSLSDYTFSQMGLNAISLTFIPARLREDALASLFPVIAKCNFKYFGQGNVQLRDGICILPQNVLCEYYFVFMWYYLLILAVLGCLQLLFRIAVIFSWRFRSELLSSASAFSSPTHIRQIAKNTSFSEWFILFQLSQNIMDSVYCVVIDEFAIAIKTREKKAEN